MCTCFAVYDWKRNIQVECIFSSCASPYINGCRLKETRITSTYSLFKMILSDKLWNIDLWRFYFYNTPIIQKLKWVNIWWSLHMYQYEHFLSIMCYIVMWKQMQFDNAWENTSENIWHSWYSNVSGDSRNAWILLILFSTQNALKLRKICYWCVNFIASFQCNSMWVIYFKSFSW